MQKEIKNLKDAKEASVKNTDFIKNKLTNAEHEIVILRKKVEETEIFYSNKQRNYLRKQETKNRRQTHRENAIQQLPIRTSTFNINRITHRSHAFGPVTANQNDPTWNQFRHANSLLAPNAKFSVSNFNFRLRQSISPSTSQDVFNLNGNYKSLFVTKIYLRELNQPNLNNKPFSNKFNFGDQCLNYRLHGLSGGKPCPANVIGHFRLFEVFAESHYDQLRPSCSSDVECMLRLEEIYWSTPACIKAHCKLGVHQLECSKKIDFSSLYGKFTPLYYKPILKKINGEGKNSFSKLSKNSAKSKNLATPPPQQLASTSAPFSHNFMTTPEDLMEDQIYNPDDDISFEDPLEDGEMLD